jgi:ABC-type transport system involved in multi-copper enzyme maturation permease subunit
MSVLSLPMSRGAYLLGKFLAISAFLAVCLVFLSLVAAGAIGFISVRYPSETAIQWGRIGLALVADLGKYVLLAALALFFSSLSTSFFLPFFGAISAFLAGSASQEVFDYVSGDYGEKIGGLGQVLIKCVYYLLPNFGAFDYKLAAIYPIPLDWAGLVYTFLYFCVYTMIILSAAVWVFSRRELP